MTLYGLPKEILDGVVEIYENLHADTCADAVCIGEHSLSQRNPAEVARSLELRLLILDLPWRSMRRGDWHSL